MSVESHADAFMDAIKRDAELADLTYEGNVKTRPEFYVSVFTPTPGDSRHRFTGPQGRQDWTYVTHSVGTSPGQARWVAARLRAQLLDTVLQVDGHRCWPIRHPAGQPMQDDTDLNPPLYYLVDEWELTSFVA